MTEAEWQKHKNDPDYKANPDMDFYRQYSDEEGPETFKLQILRALRDRNNLGAAFPLWKQHVLRGVPFFMITARSHFPANMKLGMDAFVRATFTEQELAQARQSFKMTGETYGIPAAMGWWGEAYTDPNAVLANYFHGCEFHPVSSPFWAFRHNCSGVPACKAAAVTQMLPYALAFGQHSSGAQTTVMSFYDDDKSNALAVQKRMVELAAQYPDICFRLYDTSDMTTAVQIDINDACNKIAPGADWQATAFHNNYKRSRHVSLNCC